MAQTIIPVGHPLARKVYGAAVFGELVRRPTFMNRLTGEAPDMGEVVSKLERMQTSPNYPIVRVTDLGKSAGDRVSIDMFNILQGRPVTGDKKLAGRMMSLKSDSLDLTIDQMRGGVDPGGRMTQQRTIHNLRTVGRAGLAGWWARLTDQVKLIHFAGDRGYHNSPDWVVPLASDAEFKDIMVNPVLPPTFDKHFYAGGKANHAALTATDILTLDDIDRMRAAIDEMDNPMQPVILPDDPAGEDEPLYVLGISHRMWHYLQNRTGPTAWRTFLMNARERSSKNPLFAGEPGMWNGILVKKLPRPIRFPLGTGVAVSNNDANATVPGTPPAGAIIPATLTGAPAGTTPADFAVDRGILFGAQALAEIWGQHSKSGTHMAWHEETSDHDNTYEASISAIGGVGKLRFRNAAGNVIDHGVAVIDCVAPDPRKVVIPSA